jgi:hypothetical protein
MGKIDWAQNRRSMHAIEFLDGWQYGVTWQFALPNEQHMPDEPPPGTGWELNVDRGDSGRTVELPVWSDGSVVQQRTHWRRKHRLRAGARAVYVHVDRRPWWIGSRIPDRMLPVDNVRGEDRDRGKLSVVASRVP